MKRIGVYGGTFNPIHNGHINIALKLADKLMLDKVLVIPNHIPPHKKDVFLLDSHIRYEMCKLAVQGYPILEVDDIEIHQQGKSYTVNTLEGILKREEDCELFLIVGSDNFLKISKWFGFEKIKKIATICTIPRNYENMTKIMEMGKKLREDGTKVEIYAPKILNISSSEVRNKVIHGQKIINKIDPKVYEYIQKNHLYTDNKKEWYMNYG